MDTAFFILSKLLAPALRVDTWIIVGFGLVALALLRGWRRAALALSSAAFALLLLLAVFPVGDLLLARIEDSYPPNPPLEDVHGIVVLSGGEDSDAGAFRGRMEFGDGADRHIATAVLARRFPDARIVYTGGSGKLRTLITETGPEIAIAREFYIALGTDPDRLLLEGEARNTAENATLSLALADPRPGQTWVLVTSAFHMPRAMRSFEAAGWPAVIPYPVDYRAGAFVDRTGWNLTRNMRQLDTALREIVGALAYRMAGR